jgi:hypothetical protein
LRDGRGQGLGPLEPTKLCFFGKCSKEIFDLDRSWKRADRGIQRLPAVWADITGKRAIVLRGLLGDESLGCSCWLRAPLPFS